MSVVLKILFNKFDVLFIVTFYRLVFKQRKPAILILESIQTIQCVFYKDRSIASMKVFVTQ